MSGSLGDQQVYNLSVTGPHTYYVTDTSILAHNCPVDADSPYSQAIQARDEKADEVGSKVATVTTGYDKSGNVKPGCSGGRICAEDRVVEAVGVPANEVTFTPAIRPRNGEEVPICPTCQSKYSPSQFPADVKYDPTGAWNG